MDEIKGKLTDKSQEILTKWEEKSRDFIGSFIDMFGRDGRLVSLVKSFSKTNIFQDEDENNNETGKEWCIDSKIYKFCLTLLGLVVRKLINLIQD